MDHEIHLYATNELQNYCEENHNNKTQAIDRMKTYIEGAYDRMDGHSASVTAKSDAVYAPVQNTGESFNGTHPCEGHRKSYDGILTWWKVNAVCQGYDAADFSNLLITAGKSDDGNPWISGGKIDGIMGVCITGIKAAEVPSTYQDYGMGGEYRAVRTAHHELGHAMMGDVDNSHDWGATNQYGTSDHYMTPMYVQGSYNQCGNSQSTEGSRGWNQKWSNCCESQW